MTSEYTVTVITGIRKGAGTDASVSLIIKGNTLTHYCHKVIISKIKVCKILKKKLFANITLWPHLSGLGYPTWYPGPATQNL